MTLRQMLSAVPDEAELQTRAARARRRALAALGQPEPATRRWLWAPAAALSLVLVAGAVWVQSLWRVEPLVLQPPAPVVAEVPAAPAPVKTPARPSQDRLQVQLVLSNGTRVLWTFDKDFSL